MCTSNCFTVSLSHYPNSFHICEGTSVEYTKDVCNFRKYFKITGLNERLSKVNAFKIVLASKHCLFLMLFRSQWHFMGGLPVEFLVYFLLKKSIYNS